MFTTITIKDKDYKLKLDAKSSVELEKKLGTNPVNVLIKIGSANEVPELSILLTILHASLQSFNHGISMSDVYEMYDGWLEDGHNMLDLIPVIIEVFKTSGFINAGDEESKN